MVGGPSSRSARAARSSSRRPRDVRPSIHAHDSLEVVVARELDEVLGALAEEVLVIGVGAVLHEEFDDVDPFAASLVVEHGGPQRLIATTVFDGEAGSSGQGDLRGAELVEGG